jgi:cell division protein FtsB
MRLLKRVVLPALLALAVYYAVFGGEYSIFELRQARIDIENAEVELVDLRERVDSLRARADSLENDPATLERIARERFGMVREGETLYRFAAPSDEEVPMGQPGPSPD